MNETTPERHEPKTEESIVRSLARRVARALMGVLVRYACSATANFSDQGVDLIRLQISLVKDGRFS
jgi:hypothetical protein